MASKCMKKIDNNGFTLIELLLVIAVIGILTGVVIVAVNPSARYASARDVRRLADIEYIASGLVANQTNNDGSMPAEVTAMGIGSAAMIGTDSGNCQNSCMATATLASCVDLTALVDSGDLGDIPLDPQNGTDDQTGYYLIANADGTFTLGACEPEGESTIAVTR